MAGSKKETLAGHAVLDHVPEMVTISDREGKVVYGNRATERVSGYAPEEFAMLDPFEQIHPDDRPRCEVAFEQLLRTPGLSLELEHRLRHRDGTWRWVEGTFASLFEDPDVGGLLAAVRDVTERKRTEEALRESEERQAFLLELEDAVRPIADAVEVQVEVQRLLGRRLGASRVFYVEVEPDADRIVIHRDYASEVASVAGRYEITQFDARARERYRAGLTVKSEDVEKDAWLLPSQIAAFRAMEVRAWIGVPLLKGRRLAAVLVVNQSAPREWTPAEVALVEEVAQRTWAAVERSRAEEALRESEEKYRGIFNSIDEGFVVAELLFDDEAKPFDLLVLETNASFDRMMRTTDAVGKRAKEIFPDAEDSWFEAYARVVGTGESLRFENYLVPLDSWFGLYISRVGGAGSRRFAIVFNDITERKRSEEALRASEEKYHTLFESIDEGFCIAEVIFDGAGKPVDYRFLEVNPAFERHTGLRDTAGKRMRELEPRHEEYWFEIYGRVARTGNPERFQNAAEYLGGRFYDVYAFRIGAPEERKVAILFSDITRRREAEAERLMLRALEASTRAEAAERERVSRELHDRVAHTMGVAHQSLQIHAAYVQSDPTRAAKKLEFATEATKTALDQTRDLSSQLARQGKEETSHGLAAALRDLLDTHVSPGVEAELSVAGDESTIPPHAAEQAYLVMREAVRNAVEHSECGRIGISLEIEDAELRGRVEDDGSGFDPRDDLGEGRNGDRGDDASAEAMGLRSMRERMELLGGRLDVSSEPGRGTAVALRVPLAH
jgi:PAS domain S-box-containing protein